jgi:transglutaminase-like putative cysteine protease
MALMPQQDFFPENIVFPLFHHLCNMKESLLEDSFYNFSHPDIQEFGQKHCRGENKSERAISLYYAVRDEIKYNPYFIRIDEDDLIVNKVITKRQGHCIDKANLLVALCRMQGIPAKLGLARVQNHMGTSRLEEKLKTNVLSPHGYVAVWLNERWVKCTPAFNKQLCEKLGVEPLDFDGKKDSLFQAYDRVGGKYMQYLEDYGTFKSFPVVYIKSILSHEYPHLFDQEGHFLSDFLT